MDLGFLVSVLRPGMTHLLGGRGLLPRQTFSLHLGLERWLFGLIQIEWISDPSFVLSPLGHLGATTILVPDRILKAVSQEHIR